MSNTITETHQRELHSVTCYVCSRTFDAINSNANICRHCALPHLWADDKDTAWTVRLTRNDEQSAVALALYAQAIHDVSMER